MFECLRQRKHNFSTNSLHNEHYYFNAKSWRYHQEEKYSTASDGFSMVQTEQPHQVSP